MRFLILILVLISASSAYAADAPDLRSLMTADDYAAAGLDKLTAAEQARLSEWVQHYREGAIKGPPPPRTSEQRIEQTAQEDKEIVDIVANVIPAFTGWSGKTIFELDNGQIWKQRIQGNSMRYSGDDSRITITKNMMGKYSLKHLETGRAVGVQRIK